VPSEPDAEFESGVEPRGLSTTCRASPGPLPGHDASHSTRCPLSVLDLAVVADGSTSNDALAETTEIAKRADQLGYSRIWVAEHHNLGGVASTVPAVLIAHLAANTQRIRVGSGGVMLPNHAPLAIAEQFAMLESLHRGRIDLGIGRAPGSDRSTAVALRRTEDGRDDENFPRNLLDVMGLLGDRRSESGLWSQFVATPQATSYPSVILLGSSGFSAQLAGMLGIPFSFAHHFDMGGTNQAVELYRNSFEPSPVLDRPYMIVSASVLAAETREESEFLAGPGRLRRHGIRTGRFVPMMSPADAAKHREYDTAVAAPTASVVGTPDDVVAGLESLVQATGADELMLYTSTFGLTERLDSLELIADAW